MHQHDGGVTWQQTLMVTGGLPSLMSAFAVSATEYWAGGGNYAPFVGAAYHSLDSGATWSVQKIGGVYFDNIDCVSADWCAATTVDSNGASSFLTRVGA